MIEILRFDVTQPIGDRFSLFGIQDQIRDEVRPAFAVGGICGSSLVACDQRRTHVEDMDVFLGSDGTAFAE